LRHALQDAKSKMLDMKRWVDTEFHVGPARRARFDWPANSTFPSSDDVNIRRNSNYRSACSCSRNSPESTQIEPCFLYATFQKRYVRSLSLDVYSPINLVFFRIRFEAARPRAQTECLQMGPLRFLSQSEFDLSLLEKPLS
jgi:hypothetical protein